MDFQNALLDWYGIHRRNLVFREDKNPYKIWISEIMSQQTRIETLIPYFERFIEKYPDLPSLADSNEEELMRLWQGLGYYSRARNLRKAANECMNSFNGTLPKSKKELMSLSGVGDYTAGAIASIAYDEPVSAIDGNVIRVYSRLFSLDNDFSKSREKKKLDQLVTEHIPAGRAGDFNQALMELGALICLPSSPKCNDCPVCMFCKAYQQKTVGKYPFKKEKKPRIQEKKTVYIHFSVNPFRIRLLKREQPGLLHGLYGFDEMLMENARIIGNLGEYKHVFTHREWLMNGILARVDNPDETFLSIDELNRFSIPTAFQPFLQKALLYEEES